MQNLVYLEFHQDFLVFRTMFQPLRDDKASKTIATGSGSVAAAVLEGGNGAWPRHGHLPRRPVDRILAGQRMLDGALGVVGEFAVGSLPIPPAFRNRESHKHPISLERFSENANQPKPLQNPIFGRLSLKLRGRVQAHDRASFVARSRKLNLWARNRTPIGGTMAPNG